MEDQEATYKLWQLRKAAITFCDQKHYFVSPEELDETLEEFVEQFGDKPISKKKPARRDMTLLVGHNDDWKNQWLIFFPDKPKVSIAMIESLCVRMATEDFNRVCFVPKIPMSDNVRALAKSKAPQFIVAEILESTLLTILDPLDLRMDDDQDDLELTPENQLKKLECPVCFSVALPPIYNCVRGHSVCGDCCKSVAKCPLCEGKFSKRGKECLCRNFVMESLVEESVIQCEGCDGIFKGSVLKVHRQLCLLPF